MQTLEKALCELFKTGLISQELALSKTSRPDEVQRLIGIG
jgi:twitching motility protein PilT